MRILASTLLVLAFAGCGGKVFIDESGGSGGSGGMTTSSSTGTINTTTVTTSTTTTVTTTTTTSTGLTCPDNPAVEGKCDVEGQKCPMALSCCGGEVICKNGFWTYLPIFCNSFCTPECGPDHFACEGEAVCVTYIGPITTYNCQKMPC